MYEFESARGYAGDSADMSTQVTDSYAAEGVIEFGSGVEAGTNPEKQVVPFAGGDFLGVAKFVQNETGNYADKDTVSVKTMGRVLVDTLAVAVVAEEPAYVTDATGIWTNVSASAALAGTFKTSGTGIVVVDLGKG